MRNDDRLEDAEPKPDLGSAIPPSGSIVGVDYGHVRIGLAICDPERRISSPLDTYARRNSVSDAAYFVALVSAEKLAGFVVGLPISLNGTEGPKARECRQFGDWLGSVTGLPIAYQDERFTTAAAEDFLLEAGLTNKKRKARRDRVAAQLILQAFLDGQVQGSRVPGSKSNDRSDSDSRSEL